MHLSVCSYTAALFYMEPGCIVLTEEFTSLEREISLQRKRTGEIVNEALLFDHVLVQVLH